MGMERNAEFDVTAGTGKPSVSPAPKHDRRMIPEPQDDIPRTSRERGGVVGLNIVVFG